MKKLILAVLGFCPVIAIAHPGHFEGAPVAHAVAHGLYFFLAIIAVAIIATQKIATLRRARVLRKR